MPALSFLRKYSWLTGFAVLLYSIAVTLPHEKVQDWLAVAVVKPIGLRAFYLTMASLALSALALAGFVFARRLPRHPARSGLVTYGVLTLILVLLSWRFLSVNNSELVHFPQYALTGFVLMALTLTVTETLSWVTLLGGLDEAYQYAVIHATWGNPYDFNDVVLDFMGGAIGVLLCILWLDVRPRVRAGWYWKPGILLLGLVVTVGALMLLTNHAVVYEDKQRTDYWFALSRQTPMGFWFFDATWGPRTIHAIAPLEGPLVILGLLAIYSWLDSRYEFRIAG